MFVAVQQLQFIVMSLDICWCSQVIEVKNLQTNVHIFICSCLLMLDMQFYKIYLFVTIA